MLRANDFMNTKTDNAENRSLQSLVRRLWIYWTLRAWAWWRMRNVKKAFEWAATLPRDEAMMVVTRWRWHVAHADVMPEFRDVYLDAIDRLERIVTKTPNSPDQRPGGGQPKTL